MSETGPIGYPIYPEHEPKPKPPIVAVSCGFCHATYFIRPVAHLSGCPDEHASTELPTGRDYLVLSLRRLAGQFIAFTYRLEIERELLLTAIRDASRSLNPADVQEAVGTDTLAKLREK